MTDLRLGDDVLSQILSRESRYDERAYLFVLASIEFLQQHLEARRHVTGPELSRAVRDYAIERFGLLAYPVLDHWGIRKTLDIGRIVFTLVGVGLLITQPGDRIEDFDETYDFLTAFDDWSYVWQGVGPAHGGGIRRREVS
ncbi:MAG: hypothetical protein E4G90_04410 [Gemmatimonadales bacterium]|nr:MAG: hypothetical protein E4G90_04410 [Gemmatimonadales bacterium]